MSRAHSVTLAACAAVLAVLAAPVLAADADANGQGCRYRYFIDPQLAGGLTGRYELSNGERLNVTRQLSRYYAEMPITGRIEIVPVDQDLFVQRDGPVQLAFERDSFTNEVMVTGLDGKPSGPPVCPR
jgi:hypothetical protein